MGGISFLTFIVLFSLYLKNNEYEKFNYINGLNYETIFLFLLSIIILFLNIHNSKDNKKNIIYFGIIILINFKTIYLILVKWLYCII